MGRTAGGADMTITEQTTMNFSRLDMAKAQLEKDIGLDVVQMNHGGFLTAMRTLAIRHCQQGDGTVTVDDLRSKAIIYDITAPTSKSWGAIFHGKEWKRVSYEPSTVISNHARIISRWRYKGTR
jgi:hypothetical protein